MASTDAEKFKVYIEPELAGLFRAAYRLAGNRFDAEDLVQETCLRAWGKFSADRCTGRAGPWLLRVLYHLFIDRIRRDQSGPIVRPDGRIGHATESACANPGPDVLAEFHDTERLLCLAWGQLEPTQKLLLTLRAEGYGLNEIEEITGISRKVLRARLHRARKSLVRQLRSDEQVNHRSAQFGSNK